LTILTSSKVKFEWHSSHQQVFDKIKIKKVIGTEVILCYPDFNKHVLFHIYTQCIRSSVGGGHRAGLKACSHLSISQERKMLLLIKAGLRKKSLAFLFEEVNALKRQLKPEKTANSKKTKAESILSTEISVVS
jgi:hypothetical protein